MTEAIPLEYADYDEDPELPTSLEIVETIAVRPPKMSVEEAVFQLEQGPYVARLKAAQRVLSIANAYVADEQTASYMSANYLETLQNDVRTNQAELERFAQKSPPIILNDNGINPTSLGEQNTAEIEHPILEIVPTPGKKAVAASKQRDIEGRDSVNLYLEEIARVPLLNAEEEVELSKTIEAGLVAASLLEQQRVGRKNGGAPSQANLAELEWLAEEGQRAKQQFLSANLRLVVSIARKYGRAQMPMLDLIQEGNTGLIRAVEKFDYTKGYKFSTYATWWIRQAITRGIVQQARVVRLPVLVEEEVNQIGSARRTLERMLGREVEPEEIAMELGMHVERVMDLLTWSMEHVSLDAPVDDDGKTSLSDMIALDTAPGPDAELYVTETNQALEQLVQTLSERSADIIRRRYGLVDGRQEKLADIGRRHGISAERVRQLEHEALQKLRRTGNPNL